MIKDVLRTLLYGTWNAARSLGHQWDNITVPKTFGGWRRYLRDHFKGGIPESWHLMAAAGINLHEHLQRSPYRGLFPVQEQICLLVRAMAEEQQTKEQTDLFLEDDNPELRSP